MKRVLILVAALALSSTAAAQNDREQMWEFGVLINDMSSESLSGENGSSLDVDSSTGYGLLINYNFTNRLSLGGEFSWNTPDYKAVIVPDNGVGIPEVINYELDVFSYSLKGTFNLIDGPITPFVEAGFGWTEIDSNIADQPPITGCWWDPWWGYVCDTFYSTYSKTRESYSYAGGVRLDMNNGMTLKASYGVQEISTSKATEDASLDVIRVDLTWRF
jgi:opacity protein-like surface antigen